MLPMPGACVGSLVGELGSHTPRGIIFREGESEETIQLFEDFKVTETSLHAA